MGCVGQVSLIWHDVGALQSDHSVLCIIPHNVSASQGGHSVLLIIPHDVGNLQRGCLDVGTSWCNKTTGLIIRVGH